MYHYACDALRARGYQHYEVANWARPGHRCRHNLAYWLNRQYYAVGVGAHGHVGSHRTENMRHTRPYLDRLRSGASPVQRRELLDADTRRSEELMLQFRLLDEGVALSSLNRGNEASLSTLEAEVSNLESADLVRREGDRLFLTERAVPVANEVWGRLSIHVM